VIQGEQISSLEQDQYDGLTALLEAELEYFTQCRQILADLKEGWPAGCVIAPCISAREYELTR
jgi:hypothetical protein